MTAVLVLAVAALAWAQVLEVRRTREAEAALRGRLQAAEGRLEALGAAEALVTRLQAATAAAEAPARRVRAAAAVGARKR